MSDQSISKILMSLELGHSLNNITHHRVTCFGEEALSSEVTSVEGSSVLSVISYD